MKKWSYLASYSLVLFMVISLLVGGWTFFLVPIFVFGLLPLFDFIVGPNTKNPDKDMTLARKADPYFQWVMWLFVPVQWIIVVGGAYFASTQGWPWWALLGWTFSAGMVTGVAGITIAHELGHRSNALERFFSKVLLVAVNYGHFFIAELGSKLNKVGAGLSPPVLG